MTDSRSERPDARLVLLHAERGDPHARLAGALAALEGAEWGLLLSGEDALARQLASLLGGGTLRVDPRVRVSRDALAGAGLAVAGLDAEWRGARAVWLLEPDGQTLERARRAGVQVLVDATLAPGGNWPAAGADLVIYRDSVTLSGHSDAPLSALFGTGRAPEAVGAPPSDLSVALALRDVATLPLRLARAARTTSALAERLGGGAQAAGPTALLLAPDAAADTPQALGGVLAAARSVPGGVLLTPGLQEPGAVLSLLRSEGPEGLNLPQEDRSAGPGRREEGRRNEGRQEQGRREEAQSEEAQSAGDPRREERADGGRADSGRREGRFEGRRDRDGRRDGMRRPERPGRFSRGDQPSAPLPNTTAPDAPEQPQRFTFEAPQIQDEGAEPLPGRGAQAREQAGAPAPQAQVAEETWEPEIVFSTQPPHPQVSLPTPVSSGPDAPNLTALPDVLHQPEHLPAADEAAEPAFPDGAGEVQPNLVAHQPEALQAQPEHAPELLAPDLPQGKQDPSADLSDEQAAVYARLREWRNAEAKRQDISRFIIASNATLAEIARRIPYTEADLRAVKGMGPERLRKYGDKILEVVRG